MLQKLNLFILILAVCAFLATFLLKGHPSGLSNTQTTKQTHPMPASTFKPPSGGVSSYLGQSSEQVTRKLGKPERKEPSPFGYEWWIYGVNSESYLQLGMEKGKVVTLFALGDQLDTAPFKINESAQVLLKKNPPNEKPSLDYQGTHIQFQLQKEELSTRPLIKSGNHWVQLYFDQFTGKLMGVRYLTAGPLVIQRPYSLVYQGTLPERPRMSQQVQSQINQSEAREIFDISNILRSRHHVPLLAWSPQGAVAAYLHSKEMDQRHYFSHDSKWQGDLKTRLETQHITFQMAGENIAAHYEDSISVSIGWLNSAEHRKNLLNPSFTKLGVGVYQDFYTQDFVLPF
jgi:uncharacterized protein YkwD